MALAHDTLRGNKTQLAGCWKSIFGSLLDTSNLCYGIEQARDEHLAHWELFNASLQSIPDNVMSPEARATVAWAGNIWQ